MAQGKPSFWAALQQRKRMFLDLDVSDPQENRSILWRLRMVVLFVDRVFFGFVENRGPLRAAALCYTTLLALVPLLAVVFSVSKSFLRESSVTAVPQVIDLLVARVAPQLEVLPAGHTNLAAKVGQVRMTDDARREVVQSIQQFIGNIDAGTLGAIGTVALIIVAIQLLTTIEQTFNDIWGVTKGRSIWRKVVYYWASVTLGPLVLLTALTMTGSIEFSQVLDQFVAVPWLERFLFKAIPYIILWIGFGALYGLMPNTRVHWWAAAIGGIVAGTLWQLNSMLSTMYFSRVVSYSKIYGSLGILPIFLLGVYFSWFIVLFGAQVSYVVQNHRAILQQRASERLDQFGRERLACRLVLLVCRQFLHSQPALSVGELSRRLNVPTSLINRLISRLAQTGILVEIANDSPGVIPARPPDAITITDVLHALRTNSPASTKHDTDIVESLLGDLRTAERSAAANLRFSDLAGKS